MSTEEQRIYWRKLNKKRRDYNREYRKKYRKTKQGKEATLKAIKNYEANHPERRKAWLIARRLAKGLCEICAKTPTHKHHPDINKPLEVIYLCPLHHKQIHAML